jgi:hypothetical protein
MDIYNPTSVSYIIKRVEFGSKTESVEISFESQSRSGNRSFFKRCQRSMNVFVLIPSNEVISVRVKVKPKELGTHRELVTVRTNHGDMVFAVQWRAVAGEILFTPSTVRFDLFYPIESDEKSIIAKNKFHIDVEVTNAWSPQSFIFAQLKAARLRENNKDAFLGVILDLTDDESLDLRRSGYLKTFHRKYITLSDLVAYEDHVKGWDKILKEAKTEISGEVIVQTDIMNDLIINVKGHIRKAIFMQDERLVLGPLEEGRSHAVNVTLHNPTERDIEMRFYLSDNKLIDYKSIYQKSIKQLMKKYARYKKEQICLTHSQFDEEEFKYYANVLFEGITVKGFTLTKNNKRRLCFTIKTKSEKHKKFFEHKGNYNFNSTRLSRERLIRENMDIYILKDIIAYSRKPYPANPESYHNYSLFDKLQVIFSKMKNFLKINLGKPKLFKNRGVNKFFSSVSKKYFEALTSKQEFFLNPEYFKKKILLKSGMTVTLPILVYHPKEAGESKINLLIKNDYSNLIVLPVTASAGKVSLAVTKLSYETEGVMNYFLQNKEDQNKVIFYLHSSDLIQKVGKDNKKYIFKKSVKRIYDLKNTGNLPIKVNSISVDKFGCTFSGFQIVNCEGFRVGAGTVTQVGGRSLPHLQLSVRNQKGHLFAPRKPAPDSRIRRQDHRQHHS